MDFVDSLAIRTSISLQDHASFDGDLSAFVGELQLHFGYMDWIEIITCALTMDCSNNLGHDDLDPMGSSAFL